MWNLFHLGLDMLPFIFFAVVIIAVFVALAPLKLWSIDRTLKEILKELKEKDGK